MDLAMIENCGVYRIVNTTSNKTYIGSSMNINARFHRHKRLLQLMKHPNAHLQSAWIKYGDNALTFERLISCERTNLAIHEQRFIDAYKDHDMPLYNLKPSSKSRVGFSVSYETRLKMSKSKIGTAFHTGHKHSLESIEKIKAGRKRQVYTDSMIASRRAVFLGNKYKLGMKLSAEHRAAISNFMKGRKHTLGLQMSEESREKISKALTGRICSLETRKKISEAQRIFQENKHRMTDTSEWV